MKKISPNNPKNLINFIFLLLSTNVLYSQIRDYKITYNKGSDLLEYKIMVVKNGIASYKPLRNIPRLNKGDLVHVDVTDFNVFKYKVLIEKKDKSLNLEQSEYKNPFQILPSILLGSMHDFENANIGVYEKLKKPLETNGTSRGVSLEQICDALTKEVISKSELKSISDHLDILISNKSTPGTFIKKFCRENIEKYKPITEIPDLLLNEIENNENLNDSIDLIKSKILQEAKLFSDQLLNRLVMVESQIFETKFAPIEIENEKDEVIFSIQLIEVNESEKLLSHNKQYKSSIDQYQIWYSTKYLDTLNLTLEDKRCKTCKKLILAEGSYKGIPPKNPHNILDDAEKQRNTNAGPYGIWKFYDNYGEIENYFNFGASQIINNLETPQDNSSANNKKEIIDISIVTAIEIKKPMIAKIGLGLTGVRLHNEMKDFRFHTFAQGDSVNIYGVSKGFILPSLTAFLRFESPYVKRFYPGLTIGVGKSLTIKNDLHFLLGPTFRFGTLKEITLSAGIGLSLINRLRPDLKEGDNRFINLNTEESYFQTKYETSFYFGIIFDLY